MMNYLLRVEITGTNGDYLGRVFDRSRQRIVRAQEFVPENKRLVLSEHVAHRAAPGHKDHE
jgi:hypothetical protein